MGQLVSCLCGGDEEEITQSDDPTLHDAEPKLCDDPYYPLLARSIFGSTSYSVEAVHCSEEKIIHISCDALEHDQLISAPSPEDVSEMSQHRFVTSTAAPAPALEHDLLVSSFLMREKKFLYKNYSEAKSNIALLRSRGCRVFHGVDVTEMANNKWLYDKHYDRIIYNFPLAGFFQGWSRTMQLKFNRRLILRFLENTMEFLSFTGEIHITHKTNGFFFEWNLPLLASMSGLRLIEEVPFNLNDFEGYNTKYGFGGDDNFNCNPSKTYKFGFKV